MQCFYNKFGNNFNTNYNRNGKGNREKHDNITNMEHSITKF